MGGGSVNGSQEIGNVTRIVAEPSRVYQEMPLALRGCPDHLRRRKVLQPRKDGCVLPDNEGSNDLSSV